MEPDWTPVPFNLLAGNPFSHVLRSVSAISTTEAFVTGINLRDEERCVVCGYSLSLEHAHIVPRVENKTVSSLLIFRYASHHNLTIQILRYSGRRCAIWISFLLRQSLSHTRQEMVYYCAETTMRSLVIICIISAGCPKSVVVHCSSLPTHIMLFIQFKRFCFVNHSQAPDLEKYHGRAINLDP